VPEAGPGRARGKGEAVSVLVVGLSHRSAPVPVLERAAVSGDALGKLLRDVYQAEHVNGVFAVSTCNRVEVYAEVEKFHAGVSVICELLARHSAIAIGELTSHLYVHYEDRAVQHLLSVACGLDSMVIGESQILGQVRQAVALARKQGTLGRALDDLGSLALRAAKRAHSETGIDRAGANLVSVGVGLAASRLRPPGAAEEGVAGGGPAGEGPAGVGEVAGREVAGYESVAGREVAGYESVAGREAAGYESGEAGLPLRGLTVLVVGAGSMSSLAVATAARLGAGHVVVANRTPERARRLAASVAGSTAAFSELDAAIAAADLVITCTGASGVVIGVDTVTRALARRGAATGGSPAAGVPNGSVPNGSVPHGGARNAGAPNGGGRPLVLLDLALPHDVDRRAAALPGVSLLGLETLQEAGSAVSGRQAADVAAVQAILAEELAALVSARHAARVAPTVVALRTKATEVVEAELARLAGRLGELGEAAHAEIAWAMHRVVDKLLHAPTVRVKELAGSPGGDSYEAALRVLFDLDQHTIDAVTKADAGLVPGGAGAGVATPRRERPGGRREPSRGRP
jgi:glutamyl-tRNA reductase